MYWNDKEFDRLLIDTRLTLTWDVLKSLINDIINPCEKRLTLTWDVLKWKLNYIK